MKLFVHTRVGQGISIAEQKKGEAGFNFEKKWRVQMARGIGTCVKGVGCSTFPHTRARSLASPCQGKARHGWQHTLIKHYPKAI